MAETEQESGGGRLSKDDWFALQMSDPGAARAAFDDGKVDLEPWLADELRASNDHLELLGALDQSLQRTADAAEDEQPESRQAQQLDADDEPERPLPDDTISYDHWQHLSRTDRAFAQRIYDAGKVSLPFWLEDELR